MTGSSGAGRLETGMDAEAARKRPTVGFRRSFAFAKHCEEPS